VRIRCASTPAAPPTTIPHQLELATTTLDYWAQIPGANFLHTTREVVVSAPASSNATDSGTSTPADPTGLTATTTRTVIVSAPANDNPPAVSRTPSAANDNLPLPLMAATGTDATTTAQ
jgi:hypothetical protein